MKYVFALIAALLALEFVLAYSANAAYLAHVFPLLSNRIDASMLSRRHREIDALAAQFKVPRASFLHLLTVDCIYDEGPRPRKEQRPGRLVLKPKWNFKDADLFKALTDVMHMERLCKAHVIERDRRPVLRTMDHGLVQAWSMLGPTGMRNEVGGLTVDINLDEAFATRLRDDERLSFVEQLQV